MRDVLEAILTHVEREDLEDRAEDCDQATLVEIEQYTKLFWINTGPYNNLTARKFVLACTPAAFAVTPFAPAFRYFGSHGMRSSNHCACAAIVRIWDVFSRLT